MSRSKILFQVSGSIAAYKACEVISTLVKKGHQVQVVATAEALRFVGESTFEGLTQNPVRSDLWARGQAMDHIQLARWCDLAILCPASANSINQLAQGLATNLIGTLFLAYELGQKPYLMAPAMNTQMFAHPRVQQSFNELTAMGVEILPTELGPLACGEFGEGRLWQPQRIVERIEEILHPESAQKRVLLNAGGTKEPIDGVRVLANTSTGLTGKMAAEYLYRKGHQVTLLRAKSAPSPTVPISQQNFESFKDLDQQMKDLLGRSDFDWVVQMAAVSDYHTAQVLSGNQPVHPGQKIPSGDELTIKLKPNPKILGHLQQYSRNKNLKVIAFKLTHGLKEKAKTEAVAKVFAHPGVRYVVHNDFADISDETTPGAPHLFRVYRPDLSFEECGSKQEMFSYIEGCL